MRVTLRVIVLTDVPGNVLEVATNKRIVSVRGCEVSRSVETPVC